MRGAHALGLAVEAEQPLGIRSERRQRLAHVVRGRAERCRVDDHQTGNVGQRRGLDGRDLPLDLGSYAEVAEQGNLLNRAPRQREYPQPEPGSLVGGVKQGQQIGREEAGAAPLTWIDAPRSGASCRAAWSAAMSNSARPRPAAPGARARLAVVAPAAVAVAVAVAVAAVVAVARPGSARTAVTLRRPPAGGSRRACRYVPRAAR